MIKKILAIIAVICILCLTAIPCFADYYNGSGSNANDYPYGQYRFVPYYENTTIAVQSTNNDWSINSISKSTMPYEVYDGDTIYMPNVYENSLVFTSALTNQISPMNAFVNGVGGNVIYNQELTGLYEYYVSADGISSVDNTTLANAVIDISGVWLSPEFYIDIDDEFNGLGEIVVEYRNTNGVDSEYIIEWEIEAVDYVAIVNDEENITEVIPRKRIHTISLYPTTIIENTGNNKTYCYYNMARLWRMVQDNVYNHEVYYTLTTQVTRAYAEFGFLGGMGTIGFSGYCGVVNDENYDMQFVPKYSLENVIGDQDFNSTTMDLYEVGGSLASAVEGFFSLQIGPLSLGMIFIAIISLLLVLTFIRMVGRA